jgi:subtilase family serine protease
MKHIPVYLAIVLFSSVWALPIEAAYHFADYTARSPLHVYATTGKTPKGITPTQIKSIYNLPASGGSGTVAIIGAYNDGAIEQDLADFDKAFNLPICTTKNGCLTVHQMSTKEVAATSGWNLETALDVEWVHAIAPTAKILLVEAQTPSGANLLKAVDYAAKQKGISAVTMSWGGAEFTDETTLDKHFVSVSGAPFFAAAGDSGAGVSWPAASPNVISVGGTSLGFATEALLSSEVAWSGSGGGVSLYESASPAQKAYGIAKAGGMRAVPDVAYNADPASGFPIVHAGVWRTVGGTSAGAPQWAAIASLGSTTISSKLYSDAVTHPSFFHDIISGENGSCGFFCTARAKFDFVTGLGSPHTAHY